MIQSDSPQLPLSQDELNELERYLVSDKTSDECMSSLEMIDGYMTALVVGPEMVSQERWIQYMIDPDNKLEKVFESPETESAITGLLLRHASAIAAQFESNPEEFLPLYEMFGYGEPEEREIAIEEWALGFILGMELSHEAWQPLFNQENAAMLAGPLFILGRVSDDYETMSQEERDEITAMLDESIIGIHSFWQEEKEDEE
ncbi:MAG TPA: YecA family protein [Chlorobaculum parvum]|uniref:YecA family protein n=1 Tax=Chlorobaculum parvum TaxID=274539 RepID=A0A7C5DEZ0_9CHLB|nr:YecA family protein [Chlorobaculum parvum]